MSKTSEMDATIRELRDVASSINGIVDWLTEAFSGSGTASEKDPASKPSISLEQVRAVLAEKSRAGHTAEVRVLLKKYGAAKLSEIDPKNYESLMKDAEVVGNAT